MGGGPEGVRLGGVGGAKDRAGGAGDGEPLGGGGGGVGAVDDATDPVRDGGGSVGARTGRVLAATLGGGGGGGGCPLYGSQLVFFMGMLGCGGGSMSILSAITRYHLGSHAPCVAVPGSLEFLDAGIFGLESLLLQFSDFERFCMSEI